MGLPADAAGATMGGMPTKTLQYQSQRLLTRLMVGLLALLWFVGLFAPQTQHIVLLLCLCPLLALFIRPPFPVGYVNRILCVQMRN